MKYKKIPSAIHKIVYFYVYDITRYSYRIATIKIIIILNYGIQIVQYYL